jgi:hypothetical protein
VLQELHIVVNKASVMYCDNISAVYLSQNPVHHRRMKHVEIDIHFVRKKVALGELREVHVPTNLQFTDIMTKGLPTSFFEEFGASSGILQDAQTAGGVEKLVHHVANLVFYGSYITALDSL